MLSRYMGTVEVAGRKSHGLKPSLNDSSGGAMIETSRSRAAKHSAPKAHGTGAAKVAADAQLHLANYSVNAQS